MLTFSSLDHIAMASATTTTQTAPQPTDSGRFSHAGYPPIEKYQTIDGLLKSHAAEKDQTPAICYPAHGVADYEEHTAADIDRYTDIAARFYLQQGLELAVCVLYVEIY